MSARLTREHGAVLIPWLQMRVELVDGGPEDCADPGRVLLIGPSHTFAHLAEAIDLAFARWDRGQLGEFRLADGRRIGWLDDDEPGDLLDFLAEGDRPPRRPLVVDGWGWVPDQHGRESEAN